MSRFQKHIIVVGSARSGTSWLCELLARPYRYRLLFEPEHEFQTPQGHLLCDRWITSKEDAGKAHGYLTKVFRNVVDNDWIAQHSNRKWKRHLWPFIPKKYIIKFVRCNLAATYMNEVFQIPVIHIIRNPYDVIESQQRVQFPWLYDVSRFQKDNKLMAFVKEQYAFDLSGIDSMSPVEKLTVRWCLENVIPFSFSEIKSPTYKVIPFEELRNNKELFLEICHEFKLEVTPHIDKIYENPSSKAHPRGLKASAKQQQNLSAIERKQIENLLTVFKVNHY
ncbi:MAG: sulfotransferase family protein [Flavobacteriaceae bacterium]|nr:sulfotransferase family protein [Flavobacteriaceae bacterium]